MKRLWLNIRKDFRAHYRGAGGRPFMLTVLSLGFSLAFCLTYYLAWAGNLPYIEEYIYALERGGFMRLGVIVNLILYALIMPVTLNTGLYDEMHSADRFYAARLSHRRAEAAVARSITNAVISLKTLFLALTVLVLMSQYAFGLTGEWEETAKLAVFSALAVSMYSCVITALSMTKASTFFKCAAPMLAVLSSVGLGAYLRLDFGALFDTVRLSYSDYFLIALIGIQVTLFVWTVVKCMRAKSALV